MVVLNSESASKNATHPWVDCVAELSDTDNLQPSNVKNVPMYRAGIAKCKILKKELMIFTFDFR